MAVIVRDTAGDAAAVAPQQQHQRRQRNDAVPVSVPFDESDPLNNMPDVFETLVVQSVHNYHFQLFAVEFESALTIVERISPG